MRKLMSKFMAELRKLGFYVRRNVYSPWIADKNFNKHYKYLEKNTMVDITRCYELKELLLQTLHLDGDVLEVGVWRGGTGYLLSCYAQVVGKHVFLADTFNGVVKTDAKYDKSYRGGEHSDTSIGVVNELLKSCNISNHSILKGVFPDETAHIISQDKFCFVT